MRNYTEIQCCLLESGYEETRPGLWQYIAPDETISWVKVTKEFITHWMAVHAMDEPKIALKVANVFDAWEIIGMLIITTAIDKTKVFGHLLKKEAA